MDSYRRVCEETRDWCYHVHHSQGQGTSSWLFSAKLRKHQVTWLPCEIEALGIAAAIKYFSPYIVQSSYELVY